MPNEAMVSLYICRLICVLTLHSNPHSDSEISDQTVDILADLSLCSMYIYMHQQSQWAHDVYTTSPQRRCNVTTLHRRWGDWLIVLGFNDTSTLEGHFVSSPREREKRDRRESRGDEREGQGRKRNRNESEETEEIKTFPLYPYPLQG